MIERVRMKLTGPDGSEYNNFQEAAFEGVLTNCRVFALCINFATCALAHPVLVAVPSCDRCAAKMDALDSDE